MALYQANGWSAAEKPLLLQKALAASHSLVTAWDGPKLVGLGNAITDGYLVVYYPHLLVLPDYQGRSIHVHPSPDGGVTIEVDGQYFDAVGDVTDDKVRALLSQTIQEWQTRNTGG